MVFCIVNAERESKQETFALYFPFFSYAYSTVHTQTYTYLCYMYQAASPQAT